MKTITIIISPQGDAKIEASGFSGGECRTATAKLRVALGQESDEQLKPEFAQQPQLNPAHTTTGALIGK